MALCTCPVGTELPDIPNAHCPQDFGQVQKIAFQRIYKTGTTKNQFTATAKISVLASWTACLSPASGSEGTKIVISPFVEAPTSEGGDPITFGGGNETLGGEQRIIGRNPVNMSFVLRQVPQNVVSALKGLSCEELGVYLINGDGQILAIAGDTDEYFPIPIRNLFVGDLLLNGLDTPDSNSLIFSFKPNWSDNVEVVTAAFNALDLLNPED